MCARGRKGCNGNAGGAGVAAGGAQGVQMGYGIGGGAPTASVPLLPLPARALRANQRHVGAVSAAWPAADGPGQAAREEWAKAESSPYVAVEVGIRHRAPAEDGRGEGSFASGVVCIPTLERVALCDRQRLLCRRDGLVRQVLCVGGDARGVRRGLLLDHVLGLPHLLAIGEGDGLSIQVSEAAPILELERASREASPATTMHTEEGHVGIRQLARPFH